ncbi:DUF2062 domain-containing protein [Pseudomonas sp. PDM14]|uniref:DUF2062 domain-containing protein n=1 Tax=Pseudomonas sp. PDM14 TaxID=2769288 RepID=UPI00178086DD|nr:DUF2062 domain-containing protein [Pseudomonas sp. PDM14]MBD9481699.1 DUF2062 domain-containing protein [Pseudomonas sp. PDM14]
MPRRLFKRYMPDPDSIRSNKSLRFLGALLHDPNLWHLNRHSVARAMAMGLFAAFIPLPMQMLIAASLAVMARANIPISVGLVWLTNPITMPPVFYCTYKLGAWVMQLPPIQLPDNLTFDWITQELSLVWQPFLLGSVIAGIVSGALAYAITMLYWRWWVRHNWRKRRELRAARTQK